MKRSEIRFARSACVARIPRSLYSKGPRYTPQPAQLAIGRARNELRPEMENHQEVQLNAQLLMSAVRLGSPMNLQVRRKGTHKRTHKRAAGNLL